MFIRMDEPPRTALEILAECVDGSLGDMLALHGHDEAAMVRLIGLGFVTVTAEKRGRVQKFWIVPRYRITEAGRAHLAARPDQTKVRATVQAAIKRAKKPR